MAKRSAVPRRPARPAVTAAQDVDIAAVRYIESSALVAALLERDAAALNSMRTKGRQVTSALTIAEAARAILRARAAARLTVDDERVAVRALRRFERRSSRSGCACLRFWLAAALGVSRKWHYLGLRRT